MKTALLKDTFREIKKTKGRFLSIFGIVLVGVAFFTGVKASAPYMKNSADTYMDESNFLDLKIYSLTGLTDADVDEIKNTEGIKDATGVKSVDLVTTVDLVEETVQVFSYDFNDENSLNELTLTEGRMPENPGECVVRDYAIAKDGMPLGTELTFDTGTDIPVNYILNGTNYEVVGKVSTPYYFSYQYDSTTVGSGKISDVFFVSEDEFAYDGYSVIYATVEGAAEKNSYDDAYFDLVDSVKDKITDLGYIAVDRNSHFSYVDYGNCGDRMDAIAKVFPVFFYLVAALVCLTTMTRMIDEERENIGTLKALGYNKLRIAMKYITYALLASVTGAVLGCFIGLNTFPKIIFNAWNIVYRIEAFKPVSQISMCVLAAAVAVFVTVFATLAACMGELLETPALLLRPKAPKNGKKVFLEYIGFIWKHFNFTKKVTARNILRYKKRFFMTVIGIAGCTALILAGFGIKNSVSIVASEQYGNIFAYDISGQTSENTDKDAFLDEYSNDENVKDIYFITQKTGTAKKKDENSDTEKAIGLVSVDDSKRYSEFTSLNSEQTGDEITIPDDGALITYKLAKDFDLKKGDSFYISLDGENYKQIEISGIVTMYVGQYAFISDNYYYQVFGEDAPKDDFIAILNIEDSTKQEEFGASMMKKYNLGSISYYDGIASNFEKTISSLDIITLVLIVSAALLAFVVLYNLINVNISERIREIATIKVLGFYNNEVAAYVYRENIILSIIGSIFGLGLGIFLHRYIMNVIEMDDVIFPKVIFWYSYLIAFAMTIVFGLLVNLVMYKKLKNIPMVESLKSVE